MTITAATLTTNLNADLGRSEVEADLAVPIRRSVDKLSKMAKWPGMHTSADTAIVADDTYIADPTDIRVLDMITINDGTNDSEPLKIKTWRDYKRDMADGGGSTGEPDSYCRHGGRIYLYPTANASFTVAAWYWKHHPDPGSGIEFGDQFLNAIDYGTQMFYLMSKGMEKDPKLDDARGKYAEAISDVIGEADSQPRFVTYGGI